MKHLKCVHCGGGIFNGNDGRWYCKNNQSCIDHIVCYTINYGDDTQSSLLNLAYCTVKYNNKDYIIEQNLLIKPSKITVYKYWNKFIDIIDGSSKTYSYSELEKKLPIWLLLI